MQNRISKSALALEEVGRLSALSSALKQQDNMDDTNNHGSYDYETLGNLSYQQQRSPLCEGCFCAASCPDQHFLHRVVRWVKMIARSKQLMTVVFGIVPLLVGLALGIYLGRKWEQRQQQHNNTAKRVAGKQQQQQQTSLLLGYVPYILTKVFWLRSWLLTLSHLAVFATAGPWFSSDIQTEVSSDEHAASAESQSVNTPAPPEMKESERLLLLKDRRHYRESGVDLTLVPKHIAFIMDGNRRYGKNKYKSVSRGHADGGYKLRDMVHWCLEECVLEMTVYAFSTENWNRSPAEIDALMAIFCQQCEELRKESVKLQIVVRVLSTDTTPIPEHVKEKLKQLEEDTRNCKGSLYLNVCLSYGSRGEIVTACQSIAAECRDGKIAASEITEAHVESRLLTSRSPSPDILLRTSGELRISNFLLWQCAYSELFFLSKHWPDLEKEDLLEVIRGFAHGRKRRFGA